MCACAVTKLRGKTSNRCPKRYPIYQSKIPFSRWSLSDDTVYTYVYNLIEDSGGVGVGIGILFSIIMFLHAVCWGMCCEACRCLCTHKRVTRRSKCFAKRNRVYWLVFLITVIATAAGGCVSILVNSSTTYENVDTFFVHLIDTLKDAEDFLCAGPVTSQLRAGSTLEILRNTSEGNAALMAQCSNNSVGDFMHQVTTKLNSTFESSLSAIDTALTAIDTVNASLQHTNNGSKQVFKINNEADSANDAVVDLQNLLDYVHTKGKFGCCLITSDEVTGIPQSSFQNISDATASMNESLIDVNQMFNNVSRTITNDLNVTARNSINENWRKIVTEITKVEVQMIDTVSELVDRETDLSDANDSVKSSESWGEPVMAAVYALSVCFLVIAMLGFVFKKRWMMSFGAWAILFVFVWMCFAWGILLVYTMINYDSCGCDGTYDSNACQTLMETIQTNIGANTSVKIGDTSVLLAPTIESLLECPVQSNDTVSYVYSAQSNFVDLLGAGQEFNKSADVQEPLSDLRTAKDDINQTVLIVSAQNLMRNAKISVAAVDTTNLYNSTTTRAQIRELNDTLRAMQINLNDANWAVLYYTALPASVPAQINNTIVLANVSQAETAVDRVDDALKVQVPNAQAKFNASVDRAVASLDDTIAILNTTQSQTVQSINLVEELVDFIMRINRFTPCGWLGNAYATVVIGDYCETTYTTVDSVSPGAIACLAAMLLGFFLVVMMRDCVDFHYEEMVTSGQLQINAGDIKMKTISGGATLKSLGADAGAVPTPRADWGKAGTTSTG